MLHAARWLALAVLALALALGCASAQTRPSALAKAWQNTIGSVIEAPFDNSFSYGLDTAQRSIYELELQAIVPIALKSGMRIVPRLVSPFSEVPFTNGSHFDIGDSRLDVLYAGGATDAHDGPAFGIGPAFSIPTATNPQLSSGKWEAGLSLAQVYADGSWVVGVRITQLASIAGPASRPATAKFFGEPFVYYNLDDGWSLVSAPEIEADWQVSWRHDWTLPLGGGVAKTFSGLGQSFATMIAAYANAIRSAGAPTWALHAQLSLLYPRR